MTFLLGAALNALLGPREYITLRMYRDRVVLAIFRRMKRIVGLAHGLVLRILVLNLLELRVRPAAGHARPWLGYIVCEAFDEDLLL